MVSKNFIREEYRAIREDLPYKHFSQQSIISNIQKIFKGMLETLMKESFVVGAYHPTEDEVDLLPLLDWLNEQKIRASIPQIKPEKSLDMDFILFKPGDKTRKGIFNFLEPTSSKIVQPNVILLPLIACDMQGNRIGYGKGYYDKYLMQAKELGRSLVKIGVCYDEQIHSGSLPQEAHDQKLDVIVTQKRIHHTASVAA